MKKNIFKIFVLLFVLNLIPKLALASNVYLQTSRESVSVGDTFIVTVKVDTEDKNINSVEGDIVLDPNAGNVVVNDFSIAKSAFPLWPRTPSLSESGNTISFVGGVPGGLDAKDSILFNIVLEAQKEGIIKIMPKNISVFANDGEGTKLPVTLGNLTVKVLAKSESVKNSNEWVDLVMADKKSPEEFTIFLGQEPTLFEGRRFAFFTAVDNQSGISYYEVSEDGKPAIRSGSMYVLQNQDENITPNLRVTAYDKAGNTQVAFYKEPGYTLFGFSITFYVILLVIIILWFSFRKVMKIRSKKNNVLEGQ